MPRTTNGISRVSTIGKQISSSKEDIIKKNKKEIHGATKQAKEKDENFYIALNMPASTSI